MKPFSRNQRQSVFYRFLLTYCVVLVFPILVLTIFQFTVFFNNLESRMIIERERSLQTSAELIEAQITQLNRIVVRMGLSREFRPFTLTEQPFDAYRFVRAVNDYAYDNSFLERAFVHFDDDHHVYSSLYSQRFDAFLEELLWPGFSYPDVFAPGEQHALFETDAHLVLLHRFPKGHPRLWFGTVFFFIDRQLFLDYFADRDAAYDLHDHSGVLVFSSGRRPPEDGRTVLVEYTSSANRVFRHHLTYATLRQELVQYRNAYLLIITTVLLVCLPVIYLIALAQVNPIKALITFVRQATGKLPESDTRSGANEFQIIHDDIDEYVRRIDPAVKAQFFYDLLNGKVQNLDRLFERIRGLHLTWQKRNHTVVIIRTRADSGVSDDEIHAIELIGDQSLDAPAGELLVHNAPHDNQVIAIIGFEDLPERDRMANLICHSMQQPCIVGCGSPQPSPETLNTAYLEAQRAVEYGLLSRASAVVFYDDMHERSDDPLIHVPAELRSALEAGDLEKIESGFARFRTAIQDNSYSLFAVKMLYYNLLNIAVSVGEKWQYPDAFQIESSDSIDDIVNLITRIVASATADRTTHRSTPEYILKIQGFIQEHVADYALSLQLLSDEFGLSVAYISRSFKRYTGENLSTYIARLRIDRAKELLRNSGLPLQEIITSVGYADASSFIRTFRKHEDMTPGEYRSKHNPDHRVRERVISQVTK